MVANLISPRFVRLVRMRCLKSSLHRAAYAGREVATSSTRDRERRTAHILSGAGTIRRCRSKSRRSSGGSGTLDGLVGTDLGPD